MVATKVFFLCRRLQSNRLFLLTLLSLLKRGMVGFFDGREVSPVSPEVAFLLFSFANGFPRRRTSSFFVLFYHVLLVEDLTLGEDQASQPLPPFHSQVHIPFP